ncbi:helix-turn-helix domain-containing protein [Micromonospora endolithica]|uniref:Helix-turn-helix domain-containing protein n=1 Tax=Micromonospora endolithica TaxID=230091 RepID=A0A3A9YVC8_9ACTN|nr:hypothetical protein [Micromonospora endolithica]RKN39982.1 hypothetical protein D7223_28010 [Micromonospora endolithica]TWJ26153.1 hypothetical protein JD76_06333 [Micromonospora endolithica]
MQATAAPAAEATDPIPTQTPEPAPVAPVADHTVPAPAMAAAPYGPEPLTEEPASADPAQAEDSAPPAPPTDEEDEEDDAAAPSPLAAACAAGTVKLYRLRSNGTTRRLPWLTGDALEVAEWYRLRVDQGATVRQVAEECGTSKATVRRALTTLALMDEITDGLHDDLYAEDVTEVLFGAEDGDDA